MDRIKIEKLFCDHGENDWRKKYANPYPHKAAIHVLFNRKNTFTLILASLARPANLTSRTPCKYEYSWKIALKKKEWCGGLEREWKSPNLPVKWMAFIMVAAPD